MSPLSTLMRLLTALTVVALASGCASSSSISSASLVGTTWTESCPGSDPAISYLRLNADGTFAYHYDDPDDVATDSGETWSVEGATLTISWNDGFAVTEYDLTRLPSGVLPGLSTKSCGDRATLRAL